MRARPGAGGMAAAASFQPTLLRMAALLCIAAIGLEAMAALQLAQPSLGQMAV